MKIDSPDVLNAMNVYRNLQSAGTSAQVDQTKKAGAVNREYVELSTRKTEIERLGKLSQDMLAVQAMPEIRAEKVNDLKQQIADGSFRVEGIDVAKKMLRRLNVISDSGGAR